MVSPDEIDRIRADYEFKLAKMEQQLRDSSVEDQLIDLENQLSEQKKVFLATYMHATRNSSIETVELWELGDQVQPAKERTRGVTG